MTYWLDLFTGETWDEFLKSGGKTSGYRESRWGTVQKMKVGDRLLCYLTGISRFVGVLEVISEPFKGTDKIWTSDTFPARVGVKILVSVTPETAVPVQSLKDKLSVFKNLKNPNAWSGAFRGSPARWKDEDGKSIYEALMSAKANPVERPIDPRKFSRKPKVVSTKMGAVVIPVVEDEVETKTTSVTTTSSSHEQMQYNLVKLGGDLGLDVWIARNDKNRTVNGVRLGDLPRVIYELPVQFDEATVRTIELIDVLWINRKAIVAAFEIESTTSIYSGLLRMADLISMQPNLSIPLYIVAPDERRDKVVAEVNRPTFSRLDPPLSEICRYISFSSMAEKLKQAAPFISYLKPDFLDELSESFDLEDVA